jgi:PKD repeat protein
MSFNGVTVTPVATYKDTKGYDGNDFPYGLLVYDVTAQFNPAGNTLVYTQEAPSYAIYGAYLVVVYQDPATTVKKIWINDEFDLLYSGAARSVSNEEATTYAPFTGVDNTGVATANVIVIAPSADEVKTPISSTFFFNTQTFTTAFGTGYLSTPQIAFKQYDVKSALTTGADEARMQSTISGTSGDFMAVSNAILVVEKTEGAVTADFTPSTTQTGDKPYTVAFTDASTGYITSRLWTFGDGATSTDVSPSHTYTTRGTYDVSLMVTGVGSGNTNTKTRTGLVVVKEPAPVAGFSGTPLSGNAPLTVQFTDASSGVINSRLWDFGDGTTSTEVSPSHIYTTTGAKTVKLTVYGPDYSDDELKTNYVSVGIPTVDVTVTPAGVNFGTMTAGIDSTGSTQVAVTTDGGTAWTVTASANNGGYMKAGALQLASKFQLANGLGAFHDMDTSMSFMTGTPNEDRTDTANVKQAIAAADGPGSYSITLTFLGGFN